ncbi:MAG: UDP-glucose 4-epimerase GalE [Spirochaeta sp.]|nr:UDP-glucose 4-epimerase GalE [Spirochaeta sp.]
MNVLVVGGAGYIGSHVVRALLDASHTVRVYDNLSSGLRRNLQPEAEFVHGDIGDALALRSAMRGIDAIVHLAAFKAAGESMIAPEKYSINNISGTINLLNAAADMDVHRIVFSSSAAVYGEPEYLPVDETHPTNPTNYYGFTKLEIERIMAWYDSLRGIRFAALRYFNAAGYDTQRRITGLEQNPANLLPVIMEVAVGRRPALKVFGDDYETVDGTGVRDYIHVTDLADGHVRAVDKLAEEDRSFTVNLGSETGLSVLQIVEAARNVTGRPIATEIVARRPGDPARLTASATQARETLGWTARYSDVESLVRTSWFAYQQLLA